MAYSKIKKILFILLCLFVILFPFWCVRGLCVETEEVEFNVINNLTITGNNNFFSYNDSSSAKVVYFDCDNKYKYNFTNNTATTVFKIGYCSEIPSNNVTIERILNLDPGDSASIIPTGDRIYIASTVNNASNIVVTRELIEGMNGTISSLVDNVGINSFWNIFDISINYIVIVVVFALGCFIIFKLIKKVSKGKEGF